MRPCMQWLQRAAATWLLLALAAAASATGKAGEVIRIGVLAHLGVEAATEEWAPVTEQLEHALPGRAVQLVRLDYDALDHAATSGALDFVITNPAHYVNLEARAGASRLLTLQTGSVLPTTASVAVAGVVLTRADNPRLHKLADLRGQRVATIGRREFAGYEVVWRELAAQGMDPERDLGALLEVGTPMERVLDAVSSGRADAGIVRACLLENRPQWQGRFRVVGQRQDTDLPCAASTRVYPNWPIAALRGTDPDLAREVTLALLSMRAQDSPITWAVPADYQSVHELLQELHTGPYAALPAPGWRALLWRYRPWAAALAFWIIFGGLYTLLVRRQARVRSRDLARARGEHAQLRARLRQSHEQAEHMARLSILGELSGTLAHELNQPLASIGNYAQSLLLRADRGRLDERATREAAREIAGQAERAAGVISRIRSFARKRAPQRERIDAAALAADTVALFRGMQAGTPPVQISNHLDDGVRVHADALQIQQVLLNLLQNGWDAMRQFPVARPLLRVDLQNDANDVHLTVSDRGQTPQGENWAQLFEPFFTTKPDGLGLGLAICYSIAEAHGGRLSAHALSPPPGTAFTLTLPRHDEP